MRATRALRSAQLVPIGVRSLTDFPAVAWQNGLGVTRVIASAPVGGARWRISIATIQADVPFSPMPGVDRLLLPLVPGSVGIVAEGERLAASADGAFRFDGARPVRAILQGGPEEQYVLNVLTPAGAEATDERVALRQMFVNGPYLSDHPRTVCVIVRSGEIITGNGRVIRAPAVIPARYHVEARAAHVAEVVLDHPVFHHL